MKKDNIWQKLKSKNRPIRILAPMEDVTDQAFRLLIAALAPPDLFFTEFMSVEGYSSRTGHAYVARRALKSEQDRPIIAQIWGLDLDAFYYTARALSALGFDGIDLNLGCPVKKIIKNGACSAMIGNHSAVTSIIEAIRAGAPDIAISIKTRIGISSLNLDWINFLSTLDIDALTLHLRTQKELSKVPAHWEYMPSIIEAIKKNRKDLAVIGNGDIYSVDHLNTLAYNNGMDGGMIGRAIFSNPFIFSDNPDQWSTYSALDRLDLLAKHVDIYHQVYGDMKYKMPWNQLKRFFKIYINDFDGAGYIRARLMNIDGIDEFKSVLLEIRKDLMD